MAAPTEMKCVVCYAPGWWSDRLSGALGSDMNARCTCPSPGDYRVETRPLPEVGEEEVLVKVLAVGICAGDAKCFAGAPYFWG